MLEYFLDRFMLFLFFFVIREHILYDLNHSNFIEIYFMAQDMVYQYIMCYKYKGKWHSNYHEFHIFSPDRHIFKL